MFVAGKSVDPSLFGSLIQMLEKRPLAVNKYRAKSGEGRSQCFGIVKQRNHKYCGSRLNKERPEVYAELLRIGNHILPADFTYLSIQVNQNYETLEHKDVGNRGMSCIVGFGDYTGGELVIEETPVDIHHKTVFFDGSVYRHHTAPYSGNRYTLVYHTPDRDFKSVPVYQILETAKGLQLREDQNGLTRIYAKGKCIYSSDNNLPASRARKPTMMECLE